MLTSLVRKINTRPSFGSGFELGASMTVLGTGHITDPRTQFNPDRESSEFSHVR